MPPVPDTRASSAGGLVTGQRATSADARTSPESQRATSCAPPSSAAVIDSDNTRHCGACGVREPHRCAFIATPTPVNVFCTRCARWVAPDHACPSTRLDARLAAAHALVRGLCGTCQTAHGGACPAAACRCPVCLAHGFTLASHAVPVDLSPPSRSCP